MKATLHGDVERYRRRQAPKRLREKGGRRSEERKTGRGERTRPDTIPIWGWVAPPPGFRLVREDTA
jgi:hypothetical protein